MQPKPLGPVDRAAKARQSVWSTSYQDQISHGEEIRDHQHKIPPALDDPIGVCRSTPRGVEQLVRFRKALLRLLCLGQGRVDPKDVGWSGKSGDGQDHEEKRQPMDEPGIKGERAHGGPQGLVGVGEDVLSDRVPGKAEPVSEHVPEDDSLDVIKIQLNQCVTHVARGELVQDVDEGSWRSTVPKILAHLGSLRIGDLQLSGEFDETLTLSALMMSRADPSPTCDIADGP